MGPTDFSLRLSLALKALSISRGQLAAGLEVDKSVISRWLSGRQAPSGQNLVNITNFVAGHRSGFSLLDWDTSLEAFNARLGVPDAVSADAWLPQSVIAEAKTITELRGDAYEGLWRTTRVAPQQPGQYIHNNLMIRKGADGFLRFRLGVEDMRFEGVSFPTQTQLFSVGADPRTGIFVFTVLNAVLRHRAEVLDGLALTCQRNGGGAPSAVAILLERCGELSNDTEADDVAFEAGLGADVMAPADSISASVRDHLFRDIGPSAQATGGFPILMMPFVSSLSRGPLLGAEVDARQASGLP